MTDKPEKDNKPETPRERMIRLYREGVAKRAGVSFDMVAWLKEKPEPTPEAVPTNKAPLSEEDQPAHRLYGADHIGRMSKASLIEELRAHQTKKMDAMEEDQLRHLVMQVRVEEYQERLHMEAHDTGEGWGTSFIFSNFE